MQRHIGLFWKHFNGRKITVIPPFLIDGKLISVFREKDISKIIGALNIKSHYHDDNIHKDDKNL